VSADFGFPYVPKMAGHPAQTDPLSTCCTPIPKSKWNSLNREGLVMGTRSRQGGAKRRPSISYFAVSDEIVGSWSIFTRRDSGLATAPTRVAPKAHLWKDLADSQARGVRGSYSYTSPGDSLGKNAIS